MKRVEFRGHLTEADLRIVFATLLRRQTAVVGVFLLAVCLFMQSLNGFRTFTTDPLAEVISLAPIGAFIFFMGLYSRYLALRWWQQNKFMREELTGAVSDDGLEWHSGSYMHVAAPWTFFVRYREARNVILVFNAPGSAYYFLPHLFASQSDFEAAREIIRRSVPRR
jgi:hypothetical protein